MTASFGGHQSVILAPLIWGIVCSFFLFPFIVVSCSMRFNKSRSKKSKYSTCSDVKSEPHGLPAIHSIFPTGIVMIGPQSKSVTWSQLVLSLLLHTQCHLYNCNSHSHCFIYFTITVTDVYYSFITDIKNRHHFITITTTFIFVIFSKYKVKIK